jgi:pimeloyl-ACP methyl ester carboxylesterase
VTPEMIERSFELTAREGNRRAILDRGSQRRASTAYERIRELKLPTLIIWGGRDRLIPPDDAERFHRDIAGSTLAVFEDLGHAPEEEDVSAPSSALSGSCRSSEAMPTIDPTAVALDHLS